jgi:hypothetical protein
MNVPNTNFTIAGTLDELKVKGRLVLHGAHRPILVVYDRGRVFALDNRCPHMGFPLERGSIEDGISAATRAAHGAVGAVKAALSVSSASCVSSFAAALTSAMIFLASIVCGLLGRPPGLPDLPGLKLVDRFPPRGTVASDCLFDCLL